VAAQGEEPGLLFSEVQKLIAHHGTAASPLAMRFQEEGSDFNHHMEAHRRLNAAIAAHLDGAEASGWPADVLGGRILLLYNAAALHAVREIGCQLEDPGLLSDADQRVGQFAGVSLDDVAVVRYRAAALCF
jgi:hypothetical protein